MIIFRVMLLGLVLLFVSACGGGGGGGAAPPPVPPVDADMGGFWFGTLNYDDQTSDEMVGFTTSDGRFTLISLETFGPDTVGQYIGTATVTGSDLTGTGSAYAPFGFTWENGSTVLDISISAVIDEQISFSGTWEASSGDSGSFEMFYDPGYELDSSLSLLEGVWYVYDDTLNPVLTMTIEASGTFSASNVQGCQSMGQASIINAANNIYNWDVVISDCPLAGDYSGIAMLGEDDIDPANPETIVLVSFSNDQQALLLPLER